jgi:hypothetical protein
MSDELVADMRRRAEEADWPAPEVISGWADRIEADARRMAELEGLVKEALPERLNEAQLNDAALSFRHDFGLLDSGDQFSVRFECAEWWRAIRKALLARMGGSDGSA